MGTPLPAGYSKLMPPDVIPAALCVRGVALGAMRAFRPRR